MLNKLLRPLLNFSQQGYLLQVFDTSLHIKWQTVQIQISWLLQKPTDLDLHWLQKREISGFSRTRIKQLLCSDTIFPENKYLVESNCKSILFYDSWMRRPIGDQEVAGSTPAEVGNILSWRSIMKYFLRSFSPFRWFKKGSCQFLAKECAQYWLTA